MSMLCSQNPFTISTTTLTFVCFDSKNLLQSFARRLLHVLFCLNLFYLTTEEEVERFHFWEKNDNHQNIMYEAIIWYIKYVEKVKTA